MSDNKKTFVADKIRTSEICGIDGDLLIHSTSSQTISSISGNYITGQHLGISGESVHISGAEMVITDNGGDGVIDLKSGEFDHLVVDGSGFHASLRCPLLRWRGEGAGGLWCPQRSAQGRECAL